MTKRRLMWVGIVVCLALLACATAGLLTRPHPVNWENFERIRVGMTRAEVEEVVGCPAGYYATEPQPGFCGIVLAYWVLGWEIGDPAFLFSPDGPEEWASNSGRGLVWFDVEGQVRYANFHELVPREQSGIFDRLRAWLGW